MTKIDREDIQIISRHSNWSEKSVQNYLKKEVYNDEKSWRRFLELFSISLGIGFTTAGILFFFAYNWADLNKFVKIGLIEGLIITTTCIVLFSKLSTLVKNILLTASSVLVGVLFAVFGQIYQTGANAYDFFLGWTMMITLWVVISNFAPLWLIFITLINTTIVMYSQQVAFDWSEIYLYTLLFVVNSFLLIASFLAKKWIANEKPPIWFSNIIALAAISLSTLGVSIGLFEYEKSTFYLLLSFTSAFYAVGIIFGIRVKSGFYLSTIPFSIIILLSVFMVKISNDANVFFLISLFVIVSVTLVIMNLIKMQKNG